jgi:hypothetical protein
MSRGKAEAIVARLLSNAADIQYGSVSITANIHNGRIMNVIYSTTESTREAEADGKAGTKGKDHET